MSADTSAETSARARPVGSSGGASPGSPVGGASSGASRHGASAKRRTLGHEPALDGLRGLAVAGVLLFHLGEANVLPGLQNVSKGGFLGVSAFFTLSGFLITSLLILEYESVGHISLGGFWSRRFRRLLPASLVTLGAVAVLTPLVGSQVQLRDLPAEIWSTLAYVVNWRFVVSGSDYAATFNGMPSPVKHFWSLAVEEQCYFVLPFVVAITLRFGHQRRRLIGTVFAMIAVGSTVTMLVVGGGAYANRVYMGTDTRAAELAIGGLLAVALAGRTKVRTTPAFVATSVGGPVALALVLLAWSSTSLRETWLYRGGFALHAAAVALVIASLLQPRTPLQRLLALKPFTFLGRISYGVYLIHWPVVWWLSPARLHASGAGAAVIQAGVTLALAVLSYRFVEQPIRTGRVIVSWQRAVVPLVSIAAIALVAFALPAPDRGRIVALDASKEAVIPTTVAPAPNETAPPPPVRVMVVGDSFALSVGLGLQHWATSSGKIGTLNTGIVGCGFGRGGMNRGIGLEREWPDACKQRETILQEQMDEFRPDVVLLTGGMWDITDRKLEGSREWTHIGEPEYDEYLAGEMLYLTDFFARSGAKVVWTTAPHFQPQYNPQTYMGKPPYFEEEAGRSERFNEVLRFALTQRPDASIIELAQWMEEFPGGEFSPDLRIDGVHFTEQSTDLVAAEFLGPKLVAIGRA